MIKPTFSCSFGTFDENAHPPWLMMPNGELFMITLYNGDDTDVSIVSPAMAKLEEVLDATPRKQSNGTLKTPARIKNMRDFRLTGLMSGTTFIEARKDGRLLARLEVNVTEPIPFTVTFNYVSDNAGHRTTRDISTLDDLIIKANFYLTSSANIKIIKHNARALPFDRNLGRVVQYRTVWDIIASKRDKTATFNIFFVWEYEQDDTLDHDDADAAAMQRVCMFEDDCSDPHLTLVHELIHLMGLPHYKKAGYVMSETADGGSVTKSQVIKMRAILKHIQKLSS